MKKYWLLFLLFFSSCINVNKKEYYYKNSIKLNIVLSKDLISFSDGYLKVSLYDGNKFLEEKIVYNISHKFGDIDNKKILVNFSKNEKKSDTIVVEFFLKNNNFYNENKEKFKKVMKIENLNKNYNDIDISCKNL